MRNKCRILPLLLAITMVIGLMPASTWAADKVGLPGDLNSPVGSGNYQRIYFGKYNNNPIKWRILDNSNGELFLLSEGLVTNREFYFNPGDPNDLSNKYGTSDIRNWLVGDFLNSFTAQEQAFIRQQRVFGDDKVATPTAEYNSNGDKIFLLSTDEAANSAYFPGGDTDRAVSDRLWWLRSPGSEDTKAAYVSNTGGIATGGDDVFFNFDIRPALKLNLSSILFTSAAVDGKSMTVGSNLSTVTPPTGEMKLTNLDTDTNRLNLEITNTDPRTADKGGAITIPYTGAKAGEGKYVSCVITQTTGGTETVKYYAKLATAASGTAVIDIPGNMPVGSYTIKLFNEQVNGDYQTDYASTPVEIDLTIRTIVNTTTLTLPDGYVITPNGTTSTTTKIGFGGKQCYAIGTTGDIVTLQLEDMEDTQRKFNSTGNNNYSMSDIKTHVNGIGAGQFLNSLSEKERSLLLPRTVDLKGKYSFNYDPLDNQSAWLLSIDEANALNSELRPINIQWWLRSPGNSIDKAAFVYGNGDVKTDGIGVDLSNRGVRPALTVNLSSVLFTSAAAGGKSGAVGSGLTEVTAPSGAVKLTMQDNTGLSLTVAGEDQYARHAPQGCIVTIPYTGAQTGEGKYVSCVITDSTGEVKYYGKLTTAASGTAAIGIPTDMSTGDYTIKLFNEQISGDNQTDYASTPVEIGLTVHTIINTTPLTLPGGYVITPNGTTSTTTKIGFGGKQWYAVGTAGDEVTLLLQGDDGKRPFDGSTNNYSSSGIQSYVNGAFLNGLSGKERNLLLPRIVDLKGKHSYSYSPLDNQSAWLLSIDEADTLNSGLRWLADSHYWWLRSPGDAGNKAARVINYITNNYADSSGWSVSYGYYVRPALTVDLSSVLFTSAAVDGMPGVSGTLSAYTVPASTDRVKLTMADSTQTLTIGSVTAESLASGSEVTVSYSGATTSGSNFLCVELASGGSTYRGVIKALITGSGSGTASFSLPLTLTEGSYTLKLWNEQFNAENHTNFAGEPVAESITIVDAAAFTIELPDTITAGKPFSLTVRAVDMYGNVVTGYTSTIAFSSTDPEAELPVNYTFEASDEGIKVFNNISFKNVGTNTLWIRDLLKSPDGYWKFDEGTGTTVLDSSIHKKHGTIVNEGAADWVEGAPAIRYASPYSLSLDGTDGYAQIDSGVDLADRSFSISFWAKRSGVGEEEWIISQGRRANNEGLHIGFRKDPTRFSLAFYGNDLSVNVSDDTQWHHWTVTYDYDTQIQKVYQDGIELGSHSSDSHLKSSGALLVGKRFDGRPFAGEIDDLRVYYRVIPEEEIQSLAAGSTAAPYGNAEISVIVLDDGGLNYQLSNWAVTPNMTEFGGELYVAWVENENEHTQIRVKKYDGSVWSSADSGSLNKNSGKGAYNPVLMECGGTLYMAWYEETDTSDVYQVYARKYNGETNWGAPENLSCSENKAFNVKLAAEGSTLYAVWLENDGTKNQVRAKKYNGTTWSQVDAGTLNYNQDNKVNKATLPTVEVYNGTLFAAWGEKGNVRVKKYDGTTWSTADNDTSLNHDSFKTADMPILINSGSGLYIIWAEQGESEIYQVRTKKYDEASNSWDWAGGSGSLNYNQGRNVLLLNGIVYDNILYAAWTENDIVRIKTYHTSGGTWESGDNGSINYDPSKNSCGITFTVYNGELYLSWSEGSWTEEQITEGQIRVKVYE